MKDRWGLIQRGLFPETLPPCYTSVDLKRAFSGLVRTLKAKGLHQRRQSDYVRYNGTKHDGSRRYFGTPNPISYFYVASFIAEHWGEFESRYNSSPFSVSMPKVGKPTDDRPVIIPSLSELTTVASKKSGVLPSFSRLTLPNFFRASIHTRLLGLRTGLIMRRQIQVRNLKLTILTNSISSFAIASSLKLAASWLDPTHSA